jgi:hypothetical protein
LGPTATKSRRLSPNTRHQHQHQHHAPSSASTAVTITWRCSISILCSILYTKSSQYLHHTINKCRVPQAILRLQHRCSLLHHQILSPRNIQGDGRYRSCGEHYAQAPDEAAAAAAAAAVVVVVVVAAVAPTAHEVYTDATMVAAAPATALVWAAVVFKAVHTVTCDASTS